MAQRLKTDWILFLTMLAMVAFGLVMVYSASSVMAETAAIGSSLAFRVASVPSGWWCRSLVMMLLTKRRTTAGCKTPAVAFTALGIVADPAGAGVSSDRHTTAGFGWAVGLPAFRIRQAGADRLFWRTLSPGARAPSIIATPLPPAGSGGRAGDAGGGGGRPRHGHGARSHRRCGVLGGRAGGRYYMIAGACASGRRRVLHCLEALPRSRASSATSIPNTRSSADRSQGHQLKRYLQQSLSVTRHQLSSRCSRRSPWGPAACWARPDAGQAEADVPAGSPHRFHLRSSRRGTGPVRNAGRAGWLHGDPVARLARAVLSRGRFRPVSGAGRDHVIVVQAFINMSVVLDMGPTKGFRCR